MVFLAFFVGNLYNKSKPLTKKGMRTMMQSYEKQRELVSKLNVIDDVLFHKVVEDKEVCEEILRIILNKPDLAVVESPQSRGTFRDFRCIVPRQLWRLFQYRSTEKE